MQNYNKQSLTLQFEQTTLSLSRQQISSFLPCLPAKGVEETPNVIQQFRQPKPAMQGELVVELTIQHDGKQDILTKFLSIQPNAVLQNSTTLYEQDMDFVPSIPSINANSVKSLINAKENFHGHYKMINNGVIVKITPFSKTEFSFPTLTNSDISIKEKLIPLTNGAKIVTEVCCENLKITTGFLYEVPIFVPKMMPSSLSQIEQQQKQEIEQQHQQIEDELTEFDETNQPHYNINDLKEDLNSFKNHQPVRKNTSASTHLGDEETTAEISDDEIRNADSAKASPFPQFANGNGSSSSKRKSTRKTRKNSYSSFKKFSKQQQQPISHMEEEEEESCSQSHQTSNVSSQSSNQKKGDKKNVVKNFVKAFRSYINNATLEEVDAILHLKSEAELIQFRNVWATFEKESKYNNKLIKNLIVSKQYGNLFSHFLQYKAKDWLMNSQVQDKESHIEVLSGYIKASLHPDQLDSIVILKSRN